ncbi:hypothetical protein [Vallitalea guaymasensis]|uniref:hypothetical protein n=1 Tax=Vallitalea guaymasensis TaxID=1185412 RepID=UPI000DE3DA77|nr:hypothetical protein [Vallitalea guaymasensis]
MKKIVKILKEKKLVASFMVMALTMTLTSATAFAEGEYAPRSMLDSQIQTLLVNTGSDLVQTVLALVVILLPVGLTLWGIGFGVKKGLNFLKKNANKAIG